jgi:dTDP-4-dehydrorhamnose 3,5-epimerase
MEFITSSLSGAYLIQPTPKSDSRGWFTRFFCKEEFASIGHHKEWVQMNHSFTTKKGTIRGMHYQKVPHAEIKLVRCITGKIWDVIVDLRPDSPTYLQHAFYELSAENKQMLYIPEGFAHGFQTLEDNTELIYLHSNFYNPEFEAGIRFNDAKLGINWPLPLAAISDRDKEFQDF